MDNVVLHDNFNERNCVDELVCCDSDTDCQVLDRKTLALGGRRLAAQLVRNHRDGHYKVKPRRRAPHQLSARLTSDSSLAGSLVRLGPVERGMISPIRR